MAATSSKTTTTSGWPPTRTPVALLRCPGYDPDTVEATVRRAIELLGGMCRFVQPGQRVLVKPNLVVPSDPARAIVTHPSVVRAVVLLVHEVGARAVIADNTGSPLNRLAWARAYESSGLAAVAAETGAELNLELRPEHRPHPAGHLLKAVDVSHFVTEADAVISVSKLKTHTLMRFTGAVKNLFGVVPGLSKFGYHAKLQSVEQFADMLLDVVGFVRPVLSVMDAVVGMDGDGPSAGRPFPIGALLAGADPMAVDVAALTLVGCDPLRVPTCAAAVRRGWSTGRAGDLEIVGAEPAPLPVAGFRLPAGGRSDIAFLPDPIRRLGVRQMVARPVVNARRCAGCGLCIEQCPAQTIRRVRGRAQIEPAGCIYCYCCHEICPEQAIDLRQPLIRHVNTRL